VLGVQSLPLSQLASAWNLNGQPSVSPSKRCCRSFEM